tara:strand:+ start:6208 stop:9699 length:3492 start_codon:yes stop_codon:yes gene_type:complete
MTRIKQLNLRGFKSFAHKTEVLFDDKYNCIIGPNGSGKSNIGDALCFVLGRLSAKSMRAEKAANLVFNGGKKGAAAKNASVEIVFDNTMKVFPSDDDHVRISRTVSASGGSKYRVNGEKRTRTEVLDYLSLAKVNPDGYNIILQGDITRFVEMPASERRKVIEEISDVSVYEEKKRKAMLNLDKVDVKLNDAHIILKERKTYLRELKKDRDQALQFKEVKDNIDSNKATLLSMQINEKTTAYEKFDTELSSHGGKIEKIGKQMQELHEKIATEKENLKSINQDIEKKGEKTQVEVHKNVEELKVKLATDQTRYQSLKEELEKISQRKANIESELGEHKNRITGNVCEMKDIKDKIASHEKELANIATKTESFKKKNNIEQTTDIEKEIETIDASIETKQDNVHKMRQQQQELLREKDKVEYQLQSVDERMEKVQHIAKEQKQQLVELQKHKKNFKTATLRLNTCLEQDSSFAAQIGNARSSILSLQEKEVKLQAQTASAREGLSRSMAVNKVLDQKDIKGVYGTIAQLGTVKGNYNTPLEIAAGSRADNIVVANDKTAAQCISYLKKNKYGSASFIPINKIRSQSISVEDKKLLKHEGVHDFAVNLVQFDSQYKKAFEFVFGRTLVVDSIETARSVGIGTARMVTLDGDMAETTGVMRGGFLQKRAGSRFVGQGAIDSLNEVQKELGESQSIISSLDIKRSANEKEIETLRNQKNELEGSIVALEKVLHIDSGDLEASTQTKAELKKSLAEADIQLKEVQESVRSLNTELVQLKSDKQKLRSQVSQLRNPQLLAQLQAFEETRQKYREEMSALKNQLENLEKNRTNLIEPEMEKFNEILKQHDKESETFTKEREQLKERITLQEKELEVKEKESAEFYAQYKGLFAQREKVSAGITEFENKVNQLQDKSRKHEIDTNVISLKSAEIKAKLAGLNEEFSKYAKVKLLKGKEIGELQAEVRRFEVMLSKMSAVNMKALEIYEEVDKEYQSLIEKRQTLIGERTDVLTLMNEIETQKKSQFMKTFKTTNDHFKRIFGTLYSKGTAFLELQNPNKPFDAGMDIKVKLSGRRYLDIKSLSGGEKTLTALAFIFSIQEHQPASFYVLDEIDAALDKNNSEKLSKLVASYADRAQYVMVSHNDSVIAEADSLYGVSMTSEGISKVTSLKI